MHQLTHPCAFADGIVFGKGVNPEAGSYGPTIITEHELALPSSVGSSKFSPKEVWVLHGHLSTKSLDMVEVGESFSAGQIIATIGHEDENGGWPPHIHTTLWSNQRSMIYPV